MSTSSLFVLPEECLRLVFCHLGLLKCFHLKLVCKYLLALTSSDEFTKAYLSSHFCFHSFQNDVYLSFEYSEVVLRQIAFWLKRGVSRCLVTEVKDVSSVDRSEEGPRNLLVDSRCHLIRSAQTSAQAIHTQMFCGCANLKPCYWSSCSSADPDRTEFITFQTLTPVSLIAGFYIIPYQAAFHPGSPVYGVREVSIQILKPGFKPSSEVDAMNPPDQYRHIPFDLNQGVYYQSPFYPVENQAKKYHFYLPELVLCVGQVRVLLKGMHQRQPGQILMLDQDDYYMCLSRFDLLGMSVTHFVPRSPNDRANFVVDKTAIASWPVSTSVQLPTPLPAHITLHTTSS